MEVIPGVTCGMILVDSLTVSLGTGTSVLVALVVTDVLVSLVVTEGL